MKTRHASPPVVPVKATPTLRFLHYSVIFFWTQWSFYKILACNLTRYCICLYCYYTCDLNILGTCIDASVSSSQNWGVTSGIRAISTVGRKPS
jgi:hypothetical protein